MCCVILNLDINSLNAQNQSLNCNKFAGKNKGKIEKILLPNCSKSLEVHEQITPYCNIFGNIL